MVSGFRLGAYSGFAEFGLLSLGSRVHSVEPSLSNEYRASCREIMLLDFKNSRVPELDNFRDETILPVLPSLNQVNSA